MKSYHKILAVLALSSMCLAAPAPSEGEGAVKKTKKHKAVKTAQVEQKPVCEACEAIRELKETVAKQQAEIDALKGQKPAVGTEDEAARAAAAAAAQQAADAARAAADAAAKADAANAAAADAKASTATAVAAVQDTQKRVTDLENPLTIHYKGINITPGGYIAADMVWRQRAEIADTYSDFNKLPYATEPRYHQTEFRASARPSRLSVLAEGKVGATKLSGYYEMDFEGAAPTANENQSSSFNIRSRQLFGQASTHGWTVTGGQTWTLLTTNKKGIMARDEWIPTTIEGNYLPGYTYARLMTLRVAKTFDEGFATAAFSVENPATQAAGVLQGTNVTGGPGIANLNNGGSSFSSNLAPDLIAKVAFDPSFGHFEIKALGRFFRDRVVGVGNNTKVAGGFGAAAVIPVAHKKVNIIAETLLGRGTARYGVASDQDGADITIYNSGSKIGQIHPLQNLQVLGGVEAHVTPKLDWYLYGGDEYVGREFARGTTNGYGSNLVNNSVCFGKDSGNNSTATFNGCPANMKYILQGTTGMWYNIYKGSYGALRYGMQYSWTYKSTWHGLNNLAPKTSDSMVFSSIRYVLP